MRVFLRTYFTAHPETVGETYGQHFRKAVVFAALMMGAGIACFIHALIPGVFVTKSSRIIEDLQQRMANRHGIG